MFIVEEENSILVYDKTGRMVYKSFDVEQYKKFNAGNLVVITKDSIDFVVELENGKNGDVTIVTDTNFISASIHEDLVLVQRKIALPIMDIYDSNLNNVLRLYQNTKDQWIYFVMKFGIPCKILIPTFLNGRMLYGSRKGKSCSYDLQSREFKVTQLPKNKGIPIQEIIKKFRVEVTS